MPLVFGLAFLGLALIALSAGKKSEDPPPDPPPSNSFIIEIRSSDPPQIVAKR